MEKKTCFYVILGVVILTIFTLTISWFFWPREDKITETVNIKGSSNSIATNQKKEYSLLHIEALSDRVQRHSIINWTILIIISVIILSYCTHHQVIKMPAKIQDKFQQSKNEDKLAECEGALVEMGYLREKAPSKTKKLKGKNKGRKMNKKIEENDEDEEIE